MSEETPIVTNENQVEESSTVEAPAPVVSDAEATPPEATSSETKTNKKSKARPRVKISLKKGQELAGKVKTITDFGAFIDIDLPQDGLVHISELARHRVEKVSDVVAVGDEVTVWVKDLDKERNRISLTMLKPVEKRYSDIQVDDVLDGTVTRIEKYGVFVDVGLEREGLVHVSELSHEYVKTPEEVVSVGDTVQVKVIKINKKKKQVNLSMKALLTPPEPEMEEVAESQEAAFEEAEPMTTTMAAAFGLLNAANDVEDEDKEKDKSSKSRRRSNELANVIARTLDTRQSDN